MNGGTPIAEVEIGEGLVADLLAEQHPDLADLPLQRMDAGWDNVMFRLGDRWAVRLPRRQVAAALIEHEQTWLPQIAPYLSLPVPTPERIGQPGQGYPWCWSVLPWLPGVAADQQEPRADQAGRFAAFLRSLHQPAPAAAPRNPVRGVPLQQRVAAIEARMQRLETTTSLITPALQRIWNRALAAPVDSQFNWLHGDLHARNVLVENGEISGIIDWGDITAGDMATDLAAIWMLFADRYSRQQAIESYGRVSESTWQRAQGWAIVFGVLLLDTGLVNEPRHAAMGEKTLRRVVADG